MSAALLTVRDLRKHYPVRDRRHGRGQVIRAVDGVSLDIHTGETLGLVGESGCGKSTLARTLLFLEQPDGGEIRFEGRPVDASDAGDLRRRVQMVFQDPYTSLPPRMRIGSILAEPLRIHRVAAGHELDRRIDRLLRDVGLPRDVRGKRPGQLSGGQRQRVGIARALALEPSLIVADEAVSALDVSVQAQILNLLKDIQRRYELALMFVSHDIGVVANMAHRIAVMYLGRIVEQGPTLDILARPLHPYTRALLAAVPDPSRRGMVDVQLHGELPDPKRIPPGCRFHPRCPLAEPVCTEDDPALEEWLEHRESACHFALSVSEQAATPGETTQATSSAEATPDLPRHQ